MKKLVFLCLDGLSWNVIDEMISRGELKHIKKLINEGASGVLRAGFPMISPKIWASIFTGKSSSKHGILDFWSRREDLRAKQIWKVLHEEGIKLGVYRPIVCWDVLHVDGFFIPGISRIELETYPESLSHVLKKHEDDREKHDMGTLEGNYSSKENDFSFHSNHFLSLIEKYEPDFSLFYDITCDTVSHFFWKRNMLNAGDFGFVQRIYERIDEFIRRIIEYADSRGSHVLVLSDHGFKGISGLDTGKKVFTIKIPGLLRTLGISECVYGSHFDVSTIFRVKPGVSSSIDDLKEKFNSLIYDGDNLFELKEQGTQLIVRIKDYHVLDEKTHVKLPSGDLIDVNQVINFNTRVTGTHCENNGVFIMNGPKIKEKANLNDLKPVDVFPLILDLMDIQISIENS
ncbi:MAG: alkaline phosphatase family protein [Candidatus Hodarchaeota archaeon]